MCPKKMVLGHSQILIIRKMRAIETIIPLTLRPEWLKGFSVLTLRTFYFLEKPKCHSEKRRKRSGCSDEESPRTLFAPRRFGDSSPLISQAPLIAQSDMCRPILRQSRFKKHALSYLLFYPTKPLFIGLHQGFLPLVEMTCVGVGQQIIVLGYPAWNICAN